MKPVWILVGLLCLLTACDKDDLTHNLQVQVNFSSATVPFPEADSVVLTLTNSGGVAVQSRKMDQGPNLYSTALNALEEGTYTVAVSVYRQGQNEADYRYDQSEPIDLREDRRLELTAPTGSRGDSWERWIELHYPDMTYSFPMNLANPAFQFVVHSSKTWDALYLDRVAYRETLSPLNIVASHSWDCAATATAGCFTSGRARNETAFQPLSTGLQGKDWNRGEVFGILMNTTTSDEVLFYHEYEY